MSFLIQHPHITQLIDKETLEAIATHIVPKLGCIISYSTFLKKWSSIFVWTVCVLWQNCICSRINCNEIVKRNLVWKKSSKFSLVREKVIRKYNISSCSNFHLFENIRYVPWGPSHNHDILEEGGVW